MVEKRIRINKTQQALAKSLGISQAAVSMWLNMKTKPTGLQRVALEQYAPEILKKIDEAWDDKGSKRDA